ncbi:type II secretion system protein GspG [Candidatus Saccharibacteria bacterium]|nr:type II secretion system protein GspG [Candidatus Saccharibacteria bacterium]
MNSKKILQLSIAAILIISILSFIIPKISSIPVNQRDDLRVEDITKIQQALEYYYEDKGVYPESLAVLADNNQPYIANLPIDPQGNDYIYQPSPTGGPYTKYSLYATLEKPDKANSSSNKFLLKSAR